MVAKVHEASKAQPWSQSDEAALSAVHLLCSHLREMQSDDALFYTVNPSTMAMIAGILEIFEDLMKGWKDASPPF
jgi:hypothetical protein